MRIYQALICTLAVIILAVALATGVCQAQEVKTFSVVGKLLTANGSPTNGAAVEARSIARDTDWKVEATATSGKDGEFSMQLAPGSYRFCAVSGQFVYFDEGEMIDVGADGSLSKQIEMRLEKGCRVEGSVIDTSNGHPVGGVRIISRNGDHAESSDSGAWSMVVSKRNHAITAMKESYIWPIVNFTASGDVVNVKVEIKPGGTINGRVVNEQGEPVAGANVRTEKSGYFRSHGTITDTDGGFVLQGQDPDSKAQVSVGAEGYDRVYEQPVVFPAGEREAQVQLTLKRPRVRTISGRVMRQDGSPVEGAKVAYGQGTNWGDYTSTQTDKDGVYTLNKASYRKNLVVASGQGWAPAWTPVEADKDVQIDFHLKPGHSLEGTVEDEDGIPVIGAYLDVAMEVKDDASCNNVYGIADVATDKDGKFKLENLPEEFVYASVYAKDYDRIENERLNVDRNDYTLVMQKAVPGQICGTVVRDSDGKPVTEFNVRLDFSRKGGASSGIAPGLCEQGVAFQPSDGTFSIKGLKVKNGYRIVVTAPGYLQASVDPVIVKPVSKEDYKEVVIHLRPADSFEGSVTDASTGSAVEGVIVTVWDTGTFGSNTSLTWNMSHTSLKSVSTRTDAAGKFRLESMPFISGAVMLEKQGFARTLLRGVSFSRPMQASLQKGATIAGSVADDQGNVPPGVYVSITHQDLNLRFDGTQIGSDGSFAVQDLPPGQYFVGHYKDSRATRHQIFELNDGETFHVDWVQKGEVTVQGRVLQHGEPVPDVKISINADRPGMNWAGSASTGEDGSYKLQLLKPGTYLITCLIGEWMDPNKTRSTKTLELAAGTNQLDFNLPYGSIAGKLMDKLTGRPLGDSSVRLYVHETYEQNSGKTGVYFQQTEPMWWPQNECKTDKNGDFQVHNVKAGEWMVCMIPDSTRSRGIPAAVIKLSDGEAKSGVVAKVPPTGSATLSIAGMDSCPKGTMIALVDDHGMIYYPEYKNGAYSTNFFNLPVGNMSAVSRSNEYLPVQVPFQVRQDETTGVSVKLAKGPRIVFRPKEGATPLTAATSVAFRITTPDGKPVMQELDGPLWGSVLAMGDESAGSASFTVKPGTYLIKASIFEDDHSWGCQPDLTDWSGEVKVKAGEDTVVELPQNR